MELMILSIYKREDSETAEESHFQYFILVFNA